MCFQPSQNTSDVGSLADQLARATVDEKTVLDFSGSGLKLNSGADGEWPVTQAVLKKIEQEDPSISKKLIFYLPSCLKYMLVAFVNIFTQFAHSENLFE